MSFAARLAAELEQFKQEGVYKRLNYLEGPQAARTKMQGRGEVVILSSTTTRFVQRAGGGRRRERRPR